MRYYIQITLLDWSRDQLEKHGREIMSGLGNLYARITSKKIQRRVEDTEKRSVQDIARQAPEGSTLQELLLSVEKLSSLVQARMEGLLIADALDEIMLTLTKV